jgi:channel protein (hemolysin III family)
MEPTDLGKPRLRGRLHQYAFFVALVCGIVLSSIAWSRPGISPFLSCVIYSATVCGLFGISALYHRRAWSERGYQIMKRMDHSMIFIFIAGTYTPFCVELLSPGKATLMLSLIWAGALGGVALKTVWPHLPRWVGAPLYLALGWGAIAILPDVRHHLPGPAADRRSRLQHRRGVLCLAPAQPVADRLRAPRVLSRLHARRGHLAPHRDLFRAICVVVRSGGQYVIHVRLGPGFQGADQIEQTHTEFRQRVVDSGRDDRVHGSRDQAVALQSAQRLGEHLGAHPVDPFRQLGVALRPLRERDDDQHAPGVADAVENLSAGTVPVVDIAFHQDTIPEVRTALQGALYLLGSDP